MPSADCRPVVITVTTRSRGPDFLECIDDFGFLWFEDEYTVSVASKWILAANAADALVK
jgi:hypothetical protein